MNTREKVEEWLQNRPKELEDFGIEVVRRDKQIQIVGEFLPRLVPDGFVKELF